MLHGGISNNQKFQQAFINAIAKDALQFIGVFRKDTREIVFVNEQGAMLFGYKNAAGLIGKFAPELKKRNVDDTEIRKVNEILRTKGFFTEEAEYINRDGSTFWGLLQLDPFSEDGVEYLLAQVEKIDRAKDAEQKLSGEKLRFDVLMDCASIGVIIVNRNEEIVLVNPFALKMFGYENDELVSKKLEVLIPDKFHGKHIDYHSSFFANPENRPMGAGRDLFALKKDGTEFPVEISLGTYSIENEMFAIAFVSDITLRKKAQEDIIKLNKALEEKVKQRTDELAITIEKLENQVKETEEAEAEVRKSLDKEKQLNELKSRFVTMASHEFRTPLSTVLSSTYLLQKYTQTEDQQKREKHISRIISSVNLLTDILNDFLSVGKIEEGKIEPKYSYITISDCISALINEVATIRKKEQRIIYGHIGNDVIWFDPALLKHILMNLLSNAIKFSGEGSEIFVETTNRDSVFTLRVKDHGIGISKKDQEHLFERFYRATNVNNIQGTGLGLHIVLKYTELLNGHIHCISDLGKGTEFILTFKLAHENEKDIGH
ncbi:MAG: PAS domain S-box protein [Bacteroidetes bacterium]|nr:PAS domain S-box protein [Bacteroidota bacterium]